MAKAEEPSYKRWFVVTTKPQHELLAASNLAAKQVEAFAPTYQHRRQWSDRIKVLAKPVFPGYVFCRISLDGGIPVLGTPGILGFVSFDRIPAMVPDREMEDVMRMTASGLPVEPSEYLDVGRRVRVIDGPLRGLEGILSDREHCDRVVVGIEMLRRSVSVEIDRTAIAAVDF